MGTDNDHGEWTHVLQAGSTTAGDRALTKAVLDALPDAVLLLDGEMRITEVNEAAGVLLASPRADVAGRSLPELLRRDQVEPVRQAWAQMLAGGGATRSLSTVRVDGPPWERAVTLHLGPLTAAGHVHGAVVTLHPQGAVADVREREQQADLAADLEQALRGDDIVLHYQPLVRLADNRAVAVEALVRWQHPSRGLLRPSDFLHLADTAPLAGPLGARVLRQACHAAADWTRRLGPDVELQVAVNMSERQLLQPGTVGLLREALRIADCDPARLVVEVSERALAREPAAALEALTALKGVGVEISLDDVGTETSPLSYLSRYPLDLVKIDRSLVAGLGSDPERGAVVASLVSLAHGLGVRCLAEGVETTDQLTALRRLGCDLAQGYLFSRGMEHSAATEWLERSLRPTRPQPKRGKQTSPATVERALALHAEGASLHTVAARLNVEGHRSATGRRWHHTSVAQLIAGHQFPDLDL
jgi:PAS domain S-box-containing protein